MSTDSTQHIHDQVRAAISNASPVSIHGSGSHAFMLGDFAESSRIDMTAHSGIIDYQPSELTIKARAGTALAEINDTLAEKGQRLATEIPRLSGNATFGGALATGLTGSGRPFLGAVRDHVLGAGLINGKGEIINCGGQVMKNVAGYDISRLLAGSRGNLGPILDITLKVLPIPQKQLTLAFAMDETAAIETMNKMAGKPMPVTACAYIGGRLHLRLEGSQSGVDHAAQQLAGDTVDNGAEIWAGLSNLSHDFFTGDATLWRIIAPATARLPYPDKDHERLIDWCGGLRWIKSTALDDNDFGAIRRVGATVERFRGGQTTRPAQLMSALQKKLHRRVKHAFDPKLLFNPALSDFD